MQVRFIGRTGAEVHGNQHRRGLRYTGAGIIGGPCRRGPTPTGANTKGADIIGELRSTGRRWRSLCRGQQGSYRRAVVISEDTIDTIYNIPCFFSKHLYINKS